MMDGEPAAQPVIVKERPYKLRVRYPAASRGSLEALSNTMLVNSTGSSSFAGFMKSTDTRPVISATVK